MTFYAIAYIIEERTTKGGVKVITITHSQANKANQLYKAKNPSNIRGSKTFNNVSSALSRNSAIFEQTDQESINLADYIRISKNFSQNK